MQRTRDGFLRSMGKCPQNGVEHDVQLFPNV
jgi:hypothetical protein